MNARSPTEFQNGIIDIFRQHKTLDLNIVDCDRKGNVSCEMNKDIGRKVIKLQGSLGPSNCLTIPNFKYSKGLFYYGKFYYIFYQAFNAKKFTLQFTYIFNNTDTVRFIFKYPLKQVKLFRTNAFNVEIPIDVNQHRNEMWTLFKFDPIDFIKKHNTQCKDFLPLSLATPDIFVLKSFEAFASINLRGLYISNFDFDVESMPKEMAIKTVNNAPSVQVLFVDLGKMQSESEKSDTVDSGHIKKKIEGKEKNKNDFQIGNKNNNYFNEYEENVNELQNLNDNLNKNKNFNNVQQKRTKQYETPGLEDDYNKRRERLKLNQPRVDDNLAEDSMKKILKATNVNIDDKKRSTNIEFHEMESGLLRKNMDSVNREYQENKKELIKGLFKKEESKKTPLLPDPMMHLNYIIGFTSLICPQVAYNSNGDYETNADVTKEKEINQSKKHMYFTSGTTLIKFDPFNIKQTFFFGHSKPITNFCVACKGEVLFSSQEGVNSIIRVWRTENSKCIKMLTTPFDKLKVMTENKTSQLLCTVGNEQNKETIIIWNIENLEDIKVFIRQTVPTPINTIKFSPFEANILASCGRENIKFWRIRNDHLSGKAVVLNQYARNNEFLCLDYNNTMFGEDYTDKGKLFVGTSAGCVFQVACNNQELEAVYKVQDSALLSIAANEAFCATGSKDGYLRIWPVDFSEFLIEAKHDSGVCSVDISYDALDILCGTLGGSIGILNAQNKQYKTILRSPPAVVNDVVAHPSGNFLFTLEGDNSVRVWDIEHKAEAFQFVSSKDPPTSIAAPKTMSFVCGFNSGIIKVFDLEKTEILYECKPFQTAVKNLLFIQSDKVLVCMSATGNMSIHDATNNYIQIKIIKIDQPAIYTDMSLSTLNDYFATIGSESNCALVWNAMTFGMKNRVPVTSFFIKKLCLINKNLLACALENCSVKFFSLINYEGQCIKELNNLHINGINNILNSKNFKYLITSGDEGMIKIWDMKMLFKTIKSYQQFIGHSTAVKGLSFIESKALMVSASENSGIYFWNFLGDITFIESQIAQFIENLNDPYYVKGLADKSTLNISMGKSINTRILNAKPKSENMTKDIRIKHMEKVYKAENPEANEHIEVQENPEDEEHKEQISNANALQMLPVSSEEKDQVNISYSNTDFNVDQEKLNKYINQSLNSDPTKNELMQKLLYKVKYLPNKNEKLVIPDSKTDRLTLKYCLGLSMNSVNNIVYNGFDKWYAYTVNNKIIIEFLESERKQFVLDEALDEINVLTMTSNGKYLVSGVGCVHREDYAPIYVYETDNFTLMKKLNFHFKGVQAISISPDCKYMVTIGTTEEKSICAWNFTNLTVIDSKSVKFSPFAACCEERIDKMLYFVTVSQEIVSFWKLNENFKIEAFHLKFEDLSNERMVGEFLTGVYLTPYYEGIKTCFLLLCTNKGSLYILDKETKCLLKKYIISKFALTKINFTNDNFICAGEGPIVYNWKFDQNKVQGNNFFSFLEREKPTLLFLDSAVNSLDVIESGEKCLLTTDFGSLFVLNFDEKVSMKIISSHVNCDITSLATDLSSQNLASTGKDNTLRLWTFDTLDQKFSLEKLGQSVDEVRINPRENVLVSLYENSYLRLRNLTTLKSLGSVILPEEDIQHYDFIFNNSAILCQTHQGNLFLIDVKSWEPLSLLYSKLILGDNYLPSKQVCKSLRCKSINNDKGYATACFSDGTVSVFLIEKSGGKVIIDMVDQFNMIEQYMKTTDDENIKEMYVNLTNYRSDYRCGSVFSNYFEGLVLCYHECLQFLFVRDFSRKEIVKLIPLNYFPYCLSLSDNERYIAIGTKEGFLLFIKRGENNYLSGFTLDIFPGHYDYVDAVLFSKDGKKLVSTSHNEILVWNIKN